MLHSRNMEQRLNKIPLSAFQLVHENLHDLTFEELLAKDNSVSLHQSLLASEIFKSKNGMSPEIIDDTLHFIEKP